MKRWSASIALVVVATAVTGCSTPPSAVISVAQEAAATSSAGESTPLPVTREQYEGAYATFANCMAAEGAPLVGVKRIGSVYRYSYLSQYEPVHATCYAPFQRIDVAWQIANEYDSPTQLALRACLAARGVTPDATVAGVWNQILAHGIDPVECTTGHPE